MRWILISLLILNIAAFAWFWRQGEAPRPQQPVPASPEASTLTLLSEQRPDAAPVVVDAQVGAAACHEVGPFASEAEAQQFVSSLGAGFDTLIDSRATQLRLDYRVYLPPYGSRDEAAAALETLRERLQAEGVAIDSFLMSRGELANGIALGLFAERDNAINVQRQMTELGYSVVLEEEPRMQEAAWVQVEDPAQGPTLLSRWPALSQQWPSVQRAEKLC